MLKWPLKLSNEDFDKITVSRTLITNRRWLMEHKSFLALLRPPDRAYWMDVFSGKMCQLPARSEMIDGVMCWTQDTNMSFPMESLWRDVDKQGEEVELKATNICISRNPETTNSYRIKQMYTESGTPEEERKYLNLIDALFDYSSEEYIKKEEPVRIYITDNVNNNENLNTGLPMSCWPITQLGDLYVLGGRLRDFVRVRQTVSLPDGSHARRIMAVVAPCPCEWVEDIQDICLRQGGIHKDNEVNQGAYFSALRKLVENSTMMELPVSPRKNCRTLIID